jgi:streptogramin lyase
MLRKRSLFTVGLLSLGVLIARAESFSFVTPVGLPGTLPDTDTTGDGTNNLARFRSPVALCIDSNNVIYMVDSHAIRRMSAAGTNWVVTTLAGLAAQHSSDDGTNSAARFNYPQGITLSSNGDLFVADAANNAIRKVSPVGTNWVVTTIAGVAGIAYAGSSDGTNTTARFDHPYGIASDSSGNLYVADSYNCTLRKLAPSGTNWIVTTIAGSAGASGSADGTNSMARFNGPASLVIDPANNIYITDFNNHTIRKAVFIGTNCVVSTIAGFAGAYDSRDDTNSSARFYLPQGICRDPAGNLYVTQAGDEIIRKLKPAVTNWVVLTVAGTPGMTGSADGTGSSALFANPSGIGMDAFGRLFIADQANNTVRMGRVAIILDVALSAGQLRLMWPMGATNCNLEINTNLYGGGTWGTLTSGIAAWTDSYVLTTNTSNPREFFRLHKP